MVVDGHKRVRIATDRGDATIWVRRAALDAADAKVAMIATNAGHVISTGARRRGK